MREREREKGRGKMEEEERRSRCFKLDINDRLEVWEAVSLFSRGGCYGELDTGNSH